MSLGHQIRKARESAGLTQTGLAEALAAHDPRLAKTSHLRVSDWERDLTPRLAWYVVVGIARVTSMPLEHFAEGDDR